jgi:hypothetical protein
MKIEGHLAGGWLISKLAVDCMRPESRADRIRLLGIGTLAGVLPDLDFLWYLWKKRGVTYGTDFRHHTWITHTFIFYWIPAAFLFIVGACMGNKRLKQASILFAAGTTAHLLQDGVGSGDGIMYAYPASRKMWGIGLIGKHGKEWLETYVHSPVYRIEKGIIGLSAISFLSEMHGLRKMK